MTDFKSSNLICVGNIINAHGLNGEIKLKSYTSQAEDIFSYSKIYSSDGKKIFNIKLKQLFKDNIFIASIDNLNSRSKAEILAKTKLYIEKNQLPDLAEDEFYYHDLISFKVYTEDGLDYGLVKTFENFGAGDLVQIELNNGKSELYSFNKATFPTIDLDKKSLVIVLPEYFE